MLFRFVYYNIGLTYLPKWFRGWTERKRNVHISEKFWQIVLGISPSFLNVRFNQRIVTVKTCIINKINERKKEGKKESIKY